jgi:signal transduction histidine kinase/ActR/RegA family two-component response regulator
MSSSRHVDIIDGQRAYVASRKALSGWTVVAFVPVEVFDEPLRQTGTVMAGGFLLLLLLGLGLALLLGRRTATSMAQLVASARAVAAGGAPLLTESHIAEMRQASQAVNETAALLAARRSELEASDKAKNAFLALLGHELRNPLAPIRNAVQIMKQTSPGSEAAQRATSVVDRQSAHLARLVDDLLDVTRIDHGKIELRKEVIDLRELLQSALLDHRGALEQAGLQVTLDVPATPALADCDRIRIAQIIGNLLHNAAKFTAPGGRIAIRLVQAGATAIVEVSDTGSGIAPENLERIFDLFSQERPSGVGGNSGLGIGLALARQLASLHGGTVTATSPGAGQGSTFRVELPAVVVAPSDAVVAGSTAPDRDDAVDGAGARLLVVDDNKDCAQTLAEMLTMSGHVCTLAYCGEAALLAVQRDLPDAVLLDIGLPDIDGYEVCRRLRRSNLSRQPVIIALTGWGQDQDRDMATAAGFDAHLTKPADPDQVFTVLEDLLARKERSSRRLNGSPAIANEGGPSHQVCQVAVH